MVAQGFIRILASSSPFNNPTSSVSEVRRTPSTTSLVPQTALRPFFDDLKRESRGPLVSSSRQHSRGGPRVASTSGRVSSGRLSRLEPSSRGHHAFPIMVAEQRVRLPIKPAFCSAKVFGLTSALQRIFLHLPWAN